MVNRFARRRIYLRFTIPYLSALKTNAGCWSSWEAPPSPFRTSISSTAMIALDYVQPLTPFPRKSHRLFFKSWEDASPKASTHRNLKPDPIYPYIYPSCSDSSLATTVPLLEVDRSNWVPRKFPRKFAEEIVDRFRVHCWAAIAAYMFNTKHDGSRTIIARWAGLSRLTNRVSRRLDTEQVGNSLRKGGDELVDFNLSIVKMRRNS